MSAALETRCGGCGAEIPTDHAALWEPATGKRYCSDRCSRRPPPQEVNPMSETTCKTWCGTQLYPDVVSNAVFFTQSVSEGYCSLDCKRAGRPLHPAPPPTAPAETVCRCGSGLHPRRCKVHPARYAEHCAEISAETIADEAGAPVGEAREAGSNPWAMFFATERENKDIRFRLAEVTSERDAMREAFKGAYAQLAEVTRERDALASQNIYLNDGCVDYERQLAEARGLLADFIGPDHCKCNPPCLYERTRAFLAPNPKR